MGKERAVIPLELRAGIIAGHDALLMAGGLTVMILLQERLVRPRVVVSLEKVPGLHCHRGQWRRPRGRRGDAQ